MARPRPTTRPGVLTELLELGAHEGAATWRKIVAEIERLQAMEPGTAKH